MASGAETPETWKVYADFLEEQGDPRGALMRLRESSPEHAALVQTNWDRWFPGFRRAQFRRLSWINGFVDAVELWLGEGEVVPALFTLPSLRFVREVNLTFPFRGPLTGIDALSRVKSLRVQLPWGHSLSALRGVLQKLESLELTLMHAGGDGSLTVMHEPMPKLRHLVIDAASLPQQTLGHLTHAPWLSQLVSLAITDVSNENVNVLLNRSQPFEKIGAGLQLDLLPSIADRRDALHERFPRARLRITDNAAYRFPWAQRPPFAFEVPRRAPADWETRSDVLTPVGGSRTTLASSGSPFGPEFSSYRWCANCASNRTRVIWVQEQENDDVRHGTSYWWLCEWRCLECGKFSSR